MTPKEKAQQLFYKYNSQTSDEFKSDTFKSAKIAQQCALIAVDELIEHLQPASDFGGEINIYTVEYWQEAKTELEKL